MNDPFRVTISIPTGNPDNIAGFLVYDDHVMPDAEYHRDAIELCRAVLLDLADALTVRMAQTTH